MGLDVDPPQAFSESEGDDMECLVTLQVVHPNTQVISTYM